PARLKHARDVVRARKLGGSTEPLRLYVAESMPTITGAVADHRIPMRASDVEAFAHRVAVRLGVGAALSGKADDAADAIAQDLIAHKGAGLVVAGEDQPPAVHALAHAMNAALGNVGR